MNVENQYFDENGFNAFCLDTKSKKKEIAFDLIFFDNMRD